MAPCGEVGLSRGETCQFSYINLGEFVKDGAVDYQALKETIAISMRFLDNVVDYNIVHHKNDQSRQMAEDKRKVGLGVCGFADLLKAMSLRYGSPESITLADNLFSFINFESKKASVALAKERGAFGAFKESELATGSGKLLERLKSSVSQVVNTEDWLELVAEIKQSGIRHCSTIALPPTGRSSQVIGASQSIEPHFSEFLEVTSHEQLEMIATIQKFVDESISKTINVSHETTVEQIAQIIMDAIKHNLKGITIYRDGSRSNQPKKLINDYGKI
jgi:ribonucleoside-diphosphate reductase alpha chain